MKILLISLVVIALLLLSIIMTLLILPVRLFIDSERRLAWVGYYQWFSARLKWNDQLDFKLDLPFWHRIYRLEDLVGKNSKSKRQLEKDTKKAKSSKFRFGRANIRSMFKSMKVKELKLNIDTDDFIVNAYLVPVCQGIRAWSGHEVRINFLGRNYFRFLGEVRLIKLLYGAFR